MLYIPNHTLLHERRVAFKNAFFGVERKETPFRVERRVRVLETAAEGPDGGAGVHRRREALVLEPVLVFEVLEDSRRQCHLVTADVPADGVVATHE